MHRTSGRWQLGLLLALTTALLWGLLPIALKIALERMDPYTITFTRFTVAAIVLGAILAWRGGLPSLGSLGRRSWWLLVVAIGGLLANYVLYLLALDITSPSVAQVVIQLAPLFLLLGGVYVLGEDFSRLQWTGFWTLVAGLVLFFNERLPALVHPTAGLGLGVALLLAAAVVWSLYGLAQKLLLRSLTSAQVLWLLYVASAAALAPIAHPGEIRSLDALQGWMLAFCCANTLVSYGAFAEALEHWEVSRVSAVLSLAPLVTLSAMWALGRFLPGLIAPDVLTAWSIAGALAVVAGSMVCALGARAPREPTPIEPGG